MKLTSKPLRGEKAAYRQVSPWPQGGFNGRPRESKYYERVGGCFQVSLHLAPMIGQNVRDIGIF